MEEDTTQGSGRSEGTHDMVWDPEQLDFDLVEAVRVQGLAVKDTEGALEAVAAGEHKASHHA